MKNSYFVLYADCVLTKGFSRSTICDLTRNDFCFIPNELLPFFENSRKVVFEKLLEQYSTVFPEDELRKFVDFLVIEKQYGFFTTTPELFPLLDLTFQNEQKIATAIIDYKRSSNFNWESIVAELSQFDCTALSLRFFDVFTILEIETVLAFFNDSTLRHIEIIIQDAPEIRSWQPEEMVKKFPRVLSITVAGCDAENVGFKKLSNGLTISQVFYTSDIIDSAACCGHVSAFYFACNMEHFTEAKKYNSCLHKKISIDANGNIKNCPALSTSFGHVNEKKLSDALEEKGFKKMWTIHKDQIKVCQDCEFRYICTDCRAHLSDAADIYSKPLKCNYDPYTAAWAS